MLPSRTTSAKLISGADRKVNMSVEIGMFVADDHRLLRGRQQIDACRMYLGLRCGNGYQTLHLLLLDMQGKDGDVYVSLEYFRDVLSSYLPRRVHGMTAADLIHLTQLIYYIKSI